MESAYAIELAKAWGPVWTLIIGLIAYLCWRLWQIDRRYSESMTRLIEEHTELLKETMRAEAKMAESLNKLSDLLVTRRESTHWTSTPTG